MLDFNQIKNQYPESLKVYESAILREYLQVKVLQALFESAYGSQIVFIGGTALRILHNSPRFSEDIDLDNFHLSWDAFEKMMHEVTRVLKLEGFLVETRAIEKGAYHVYLRFPQLLYELGITPMMSQNLLIRVDSYAQGYEYQPELYILNKFDVFTEIRTAPLSLLLSHKLYTAIHRKRPKGRDFYDITFLLSLTKPDYDFLSQKMNVSTAGALKEYLLSAINGFDFIALAQDVAPFLLDENQIKRVSLFKTYWEQVDLD